MIYSNEDTDKCKESNNTLGNKPNSTVGINKAINKKYSLLFISLIILPCFPSSGNCLFIHRRCCFAIGTIKLSILKFNFQPLF